MAFSVDGTRFHYNGLDGEKGCYLFPSEEVPSEELIEPVKGEWTTDLRHKKRGLIDGIDPGNITQTGWGVIFSEQSAQCVRIALAPLLAFRRDQAGAYYREYSGDQGYQTGETSSFFLNRHGAAPGPVDPDNVPFYLLIVGGPEEIPFSFQYNLGIQYAVGRLHFERVEDYAVYASAVVSHGRAMGPEVRRLALFGPQNPDDVQTLESSRLLVSGLADKLGTHPAREKMELGTIVGEAANKQRLYELLGGSEKPDILFTAGHGVGYQCDHHNQLKRQGGLVCSDWPGPKAGNMTADMIFSAADLDIRSSMKGMISFFFACYSAGTPRFCDVSRTETHSSLASKPFIASLPRQILSHQYGAGLAVVGHVDRAFGTSFSWNGGTSQTQTFYNCLGRLLEGKPLGWAMQSFGMRYAELTAQLAEIRECCELFPQLTRKTPSLARIAQAAHDTRNFVILGDPAVSV